MMRPILSEIIGPLRPVWMTVDPPVSQKQPCHQPRRRPTRLLGQHPPGRQVDGCPRDEQVELSSLILKIHRAAAPASHGRFPDSGRSCLPLHSRPEHAKSPNRQTHPSPARANSVRPTAQRYRHAGGRRLASRGKPLGRASKPAAPASGRLSHRPCRSAERRRTASQSPHRPERWLRPMDAMDSGPAVLHHGWSRGRCIARLYNHERPHLGYRNQGRRPWDTVEQCSPSAPVRQIEGFRERRISGSS